MNSLTAINIENPRGKLDECSKFIIDDVNTPFTFHDIVDMDQEYTISFWVKSDGAGRMNVEGTRFDTDDTWSKHTYVFTALNTDMFFHFIVTGTYYFYHPQLELGNKATDWTEAPEDVEKSIDDLSDELHTEIVKQTAQAIVTSEGMFVTALESYVEMDEYTDFKTTVESEFAVQANQIEMKFDSATNKVNEVDSDLQDTKDKWNKRFIFAEDGLTIKAGENAMQIVIDNDIIFFKKNGKSFGWWDGIDFHTGNIVVEVNERAQFGSFGFVPRSDGSLMFLKLDDSNNKYSLLILTQPKALTVVDGEDAIFSIEVSGEVESYQWQISADGDTYTDIPESEGGTLTSITISETTTSDDGTYVRCIISNRLGNQTISDAVQLKVVDAGTLLITTQPQDQSILLGGTATFKVEAVGPNLKYTWMYNNGGSYSVSHPVEGNVGSSGLEWAVVDGPELRVTPPTISQSGYKFYCVVSSGDGTTAPSIETDEVTLTVTEE